METEVVLDSSSIFWKIYAKEVQTPPNEQPADKQPIIQLEWGWTAGMSEKDLENYAEDAPQGKETVLTTLQMAEELRDQLNEIISRHEK